MLYYCNKYNFENTKAKNLTVVLTNEVYMCVCVCICVQYTGSQAGWGEAVRCGKKTT